MSCTFRLFRCGSVDVAREHALLSGNLKGYADGREAKTGIASWIAFYNGRRPHQALGNRTPMAVWREGITGALNGTAVDMTLRLDNAPALPACAARLIVREDSKSVPLLRKNASLLLARNNSLQDVPDELATEPKESARLWRKRIREYDHNPLGWVERGNANERVRLAEAVTKAGAGLDWFDAVAKVLAGEHR